MILSYDETEMHYQQLICKININNNCNSLNKIFPDISSKNEQKSIYKISNYYQFEILPKSFKNSGNNQLTEILKKEIEIIIKKYKNLNIDNSINTTDEDTFKKKLNEGYNYPCYPGHKEGKNLLIFVRNYLILKKKNIKK